MNLKYVAIAWVFVVLLSCGNNKQQRQNNTVHYMTDSSRFLYFAPDGKWLPSWSSDNNITYHWMGEPRTLHPFNELHGGKLMIYALTHQTLVALDLHTHRLIPDLADSLPKISSDGLTYTYTLRPEATFDDGSPILAEDVLFSFKAAICPLVNNPNMKAYLDQIQSIQAIDASNQISISMKGPYLLNEYLAAEVPILQRKIYDRQNVLANYTIEMFNNENLENDTALNSWAASFNDDAIGTNLHNISGSGPYRIQSWNVGQSIVLEKKANHWTTRLPLPTPIHMAFANQIVFKVIADETAQQLAFKKQEIDVSSWLTTRAMIELQKDTGFQKNYHSEFVEFINYSYIALNNKPDGVKRKKFFTDKQVRRALAHLVPVDDIIRVIYLGKAKRQTGPVSPVKKEYNTNLTPIAYDVNKAISLLEEAGWKDTDRNGIRDKIVDGKKLQFDVELVYQAGNPITHDIADMIAEAMMPAGIKARPTAWDVNTTVTKAVAHDFDMFMGAINGSVLPDDFKQLWHTSSWIEGGANFSGFGNPQSDALIDSIRAEIHDDVRRPMVMRFQQMVYDEQPVIFVSSTFRKIAIHKRFEHANMYFERPGVLLNYLLLRKGSVAHTISPTH